jgi:carbonic anhydrase
MSNFDELLRNNARFAATGAKDRVPAIPFIPNKQVYILTCIDPRVGPAQVFGLELGDAIVARAIPTTPRPAWSPPSCRRGPARTADPRSFSHTIVM